MLSQIMEEKKTKLRFSCQDDINLLKEAVAQNPFEDPKKWKLVQANLVEITAKHFSTRAVRDHANHLLERFKHEDFSNLRRSGTEEMYAEKEQLLQELLSLKEEFGGSKHKKNKNKRNETAIGMEIRASGTSLPSTSLQPNPSENHSENSDLCSDLDDIPIVNVEANEIYDLQDEPLQENLDSIPTTAASSSVHERNKCRKKRKSVKPSLIDMLRDKRKEDTEIEVKRIALEERLLELEERKIEIEGRRLRLEEEKFRIFAAEQEGQRKLLNDLIARVLEKK